jgi:hypothetical protein
MVTQIALTPPVLHSWIDRTSIDMVCKWNAARYAQEYNHELTVALLTEEVGEVQEAFNTNNIVEILDGLGDIAYVAIGAMWKAGLSAGQIHHFLQTVAEDSKFVLVIPDLLSMHMAVPSVYNLGLIALCAIHLAAVQLHGRVDSANAVLTALCVSNNTKIAVKTSSNVKANLDKGVSYVPPTADIKHIIINTTIGGQNGLA